MWSGSILKQTISKPNSFYNTKQISAATQDQCSSIVKGVTYAPSSSIPSLSFPFVIPHEILHLALPQQSAYHELTLLIYTHPASAADATGTSSIAPVLTFSANTDTAVPPDKSWLWKFNSSKPNGSLLLNTSGTAFIFDWKWYKRSHF